MIWEPSRGGAGEPLGHLVVGAHAVRVEGADDVDLAVRCQLTDDAGDERAVAGADVEIVAAGMELGLVDPQRVDVVGAGPDTSQPRVAQ